MRIAFHAPLKSPNHPVPSGDRQMARQIVKALESGGHEVRLASELRAYGREPDDDALAALKREAAGETARLLADYTRPEAWRPEAWLTYHNYYRAPDLIGPEVAQGLAIPYFGIESSFARKRRADGWGSWSAASEFGIKRAQVNFWMTRDDAQGLAEMNERLVQLPPFIEADDLLAIEQKREEGAPLRLVTVAMMRARAKLDSYRFLASALEACGDIDWMLDIVGGGPERKSVEALFQPFGDKVRFHGELERGGVAEVLSRSDALLWPGFSEAYGLVYLEAQAAGLPVLALDRGPQREVIRDGETGMLTAHEPQAYAAAIRVLADDADRRREMGKAGRKFVARERSIETARSVFSGVFKPSVPSPQPISAFPKSADVLDRFASAGRKVRLWLRDDDAVAPTPALDRFIETFAGMGLRTVLAVIPQYATQALAERLSREALVDVATHGLAHINHAPAGTKSSEFGASRDIDAVGDDISVGKARMADLFADPLPLFVPPWNRMDTRFHADLKNAGYVALSTFGVKGENVGDGLIALSTHLDIMDWATRTGRSAADLDAELADWLEDRFQSGSEVPLGVLTHHLVHDETSWSVCAGLAELFANHDAVEWIDPRAALAAAQ
ncbi:glycosyltransferase [Tepidamorphus sp. 3E244]|uniref:glycosyltransferase n=1 Tax=Tepidamorphus sp. 3E244 TaxID=3385498 RepID=UPI0038FCACEB